MKILHVIDSGGFYGAEAMLIELALEQQKIGMDVTVCSIGTHNDKEKPIELVCENRGVEVYPLRMKAGLNLWGGLEIVKYAQKNNVDIYHSHGYKGNILLGILPRLIRKKPIITTIHGWTSTSGLSKMRVYEFIDSWVLLRLDGIVLVSESMKKRKEIAGRKLKNVTTISNGISINVPKIISADPIAQTIKRLKKVGPLIGTIGRLSYEKGFDVLLQAFKIVLQSNPKASLVIIGAGRLKGSLKEQARTLGVNDKVYFSGYVADAGKYISEFDVYANSSRTEGTPITLLECLRAGVDIVATDVGGNRALLDDGRLGRVVKFCEPHSISKAIIEALTSNVRTGSEIRKRYFKENLSSRTMANQYAKFYSFFSK